MSLQYIPLVVLVLLSGKELISTRALVPPRVASTMQDHLQSHHGLTPVHANNVYSDGLADGNEPAWPTDWDITQSSRTHLLSLPFGAISLE